VDAKPEDDTAPALRAGPDRLALAAGVLALGVGLFFLGAWLFTGPEHAAWVGYRMKTNTSLSLVLASAALILLARGPDRRGGAVSRWLAGAASLIGASTLLQYATGLDLRIDELLARDFPHPETAGFPNRMSPIAAATFAALGPAIVLSSSRSASRALLGQALALAVFVMCLLAAVGYAYGAPLLYQPTQYIRISPYTALAGGLLAFGTLARRRDLGLSRLFVSVGLGGYLTRRLILLGALAPLVLGWFRLEGERRGHFSTGTGTALLVMLTMGTFVAVVVVLARSLERIDVRRREAEGERRRSAELTAALSRAATVDEVVEVTIQRGLPALGAASGAVLLLSEDGRELRVARAHGYRKQVVDAYACISMDAQLPVPEALRTHQPVFVGSPEENLRRYPQLAGALDPRHQSWASLPIHGRERPLGVLALSFAQREAFSEAQRERLLLLARQCGQAFDRALLFDEREQARTLLDSVLAAAPVGLAYLDRELRYVRVNKAMAVLNGLPVEAHIGRRLEELLPPELARWSLPHLKDVLDTNQPRCDLSVSSDLPERTGRMRHYLVSYYPVPGRDGQTAGIGIVVVDVTDEQRAREGAEAANRAKDEFMAMLGHELRNPLSPILTALQLMKLRSDETHQRERAVIERQVQHMVRLVDDLLDVSRITRGKVDLDRRRVELSGIVAKAVEVASPLFEQRMHRLFVDVPPGLAVMGDEHRLTQVMANLLNNAAKYTPPSGQIDVTGAAVDGHAVIRVRDSGVGISPDLLPRIFDLFVQGERTPDRSGGGLGLGLAIAHMLVTMHGGQVSASSDGPGQGSTFTVRLPLEITAAEEALAPAGALAASGRPARERRRVLVVDDNRDAADLLAETLRLQGHETAVAYDGPTALVMAAELRPDLAFLDIGLPVMDGYELARRLRTMGLRPLTLVAITGYGQPADRARSAAAGFDQHLVKPVGIERALAIADAPARFSRGLAAEPAGAG
jgi:PAS domain S-box-containing protein